MVLLSKMLKIVSSILPAGNSLRHLLGEYYIQYFMHAHSQLMTSVCFGKSYGMINWNLYSTPTDVAIVDTLMDLRNETLVSEVRPYRVSQGIAFTEEQHAMFHDKLPGSNIEHPHSLFRIPVRQRVDEPQSPVIAVISAGVAWDSSMQDLLPHGVSGIIAVVKNDCNESFTYEVGGDQAFFLGVGDMHESAYDNMKLDVNLAIHTHPRFDQSTGHCRYRMVRAQSARICRCMILVN